MPIIQTQNDFAMKKQLIATLVGAIILFVWQFLSWALLPIHQSEYGYTPNQDKIMEVLNQNLTEEGTYFLPGAPPGSTQEEQQATMEANVGKPWASITYHKSLDMSMGMNMLRGFAIDLLSIWLLVWLLLRFETLNLTIAVQAAVSVGIIGYLTIPYLNSIWFETDSLGHLIDAVVQWLLVGLWLGWWLTKR